MLGEPHVAIDGKQSTGDIAWFGEGGGIAGTIFNRIQWEVLRRKKSTSSFSLRKIRRVVSSIVRNCHPKESNHVLMVLISMGKANFFGGQSRQTSNRA